jgi:hypothetical protein
MIKILFVNHSQEKCGVYQYGLRVSNILNTDDRYNLCYFEVEDQFSFLEKVKSFNPDFIIYNWHELTMKWLTPKITHDFKNIKQLYFFHESRYPNFFKVDGVLMCNLTEDEKINQFSLPRPIFELEFEENKNIIPIIGSFGFGFKNKGFERVCEITNLFFDRAIIHLHITSSFFCDIDGSEANMVINNCKKMITKSSIDLKITTDFMSNEEILNFLNKNTVNMFLYDDMPGRGVSSTIDYAVSVNTPLIINNSNMFRHLLLDKPEISIENNSIDNIINMGLSPIQHFRKKWSNDNMKDKFYKILQKLQ